MKHSLSARCFLAELLRPAFRPSHRARAPQLDRQRRVLCTTDHNRVIKPHATPPIFFGDFLPLPRRYHERKFASKSGQQEALENITFSRA
jgi:hypothetical protein